MHFLIHFSESEVEVNFSLLDGVGSNALFALSLSMKPHLCVTFHFHTQCTADHFIERVKSSFADLRENDV